MTIHVLEIEGRLIPTRFYPDFGPNGAYCHADGNAFHFYMGERYQPIAEGSCNIPDDRTPGGIIEITSA